MAIHHVEAGKEMRIVGPAKVSIVAAFEEHFTIADFVPENPPTLASIDPATAEIGGPDLTLTVTGSNFIAASQIVFNGGGEPTTFVDANTLTTQVKPSTASAAGDFPVLVRTLGHETAAQTFSFTAPAGTRRKG